MNQTDQIRQFIREAYIEPARQRGEITVRVVAGEVHRGLRLHNRVPMVCNALKSPTLLKECNVRILGEEGPPSGQSTTVAVVYSLAPGPSPTAGAHSSGTTGKHPLWSLRGAAKELYEELGGGEAFLRAERERFYGGPSEME